MYLCFGNILCNRFDALITGLNYCQDVALPHDQQVISANLDLCAGVFAIQYGIAHLNGYGLVFFAGDESSVFHKFNRREVIKKVGLMTMAVLPLVVSITAPTAASAQSGVLACTNCITDLGLINGEPTGICPDECAGLMCTCYGNNSCMGVGQLVLNITCDQCRTVDNNDMNNSWRCDGIPA